MTECGGYGSWPSVDLARLTRYAGLNPALTNAARASSDASASRKACTAGRRLRAVTTAKS